MMCSKQLRLLLPRLPSTKGEFVVLQLDKFSNMIQDAYSLDKSG